MKKSEIKISIIVPIYNTEKYLLKCVNSVQNQTHQNLQIILIDDGSSDNSFNVCNLLKEKDDRIEVYHTENCGSVAARKLGLEKAAGEYIGFVDSDDYIEPDMFMELLDIMISKNADFVHSGYIEEIGQVKNVMCNYDETVFELESVNDKLCFFSKYICNSSMECFVSPSIWSKLFKAEFIKKCFEKLPNNQQYGEDFICLFRCLFESKRVVLRKKAMYHYVIREQTLSHLKYDEYMFKEIGLWHNILNVVEEYGYINDIAEDIYNFYKRRMINVILADRNKKIQIPRFYYKEINKIIKKKIVLFGAGRVGQDYYLQIKKYNNCEIVLWIDSNWKKINFDYAKVAGIDNIRNAVFDLVIVAVNDISSAEEIKKVLITAGISEEKIDWEKPGMYY